MSTCVQELNDVVKNMDEKQVNIVLDFVKEMMLQINSKKSIIYQYEYPLNKNIGGVKIGLFENEKLLNSNYDFDECNDEIAKLFGVVGK